jgi:hypothetical protein
MGCPESSMAVQGCTRFSVRLSGLAFGQALAVRPAGLAEAPALKGGSRRSFLRSGFRNDLRVPLTLEGPARIMRGEPSRSGDTFTAISASGETPSAWPWCWRARQRDTAGTAGGRSPGVPCAAADAPGGLPPKGRGEKLPPRNGETPG